MKKNGYNNRPKALDKNRINKNSYKIYDSFLDESITPEQYEALKKKTKLLNTNSMTEEEINNIKEGMIDSVRRPINLSMASSLISNNGKNIKFNDSINEKILFKQLYEDSHKYTDDRTGRKRNTFITHNFDKKSIYYDRLYKWCIFNDVTELLMRPIYYLISRKDDDDDNHHNSMISTKPSRINKLKKQPEDKNTASTLSSKIILLQNNIAQSYKQIESITCIDFIINIEDAMGAILKKLVIRGDRLIFIFEWTEEQDFMFIISFTVIKPTWTKSEYNSSSIISLHRTDMFLEHEIMHEHNDNDNDNEDTNIVPSSLKKIDPLPSSNLPNPKKRFNLFDDYDNNDSDDKPIKKRKMSLFDHSDDDDNNNNSNNNNNNKEIGDMYYNSQKKTTTNDETLKTSNEFIVSYYGEKIDTSFLDKLKYSYISYHNYGYVKKDD